MHGTSAGVPVTLSGFGGLVTLANPETVPEGASPRTHDGDYNVGNFKTRAGLTNVYTTSNSEIGPQSPSSAKSSTWNNPASLLTNSGSYASFAFNSTGSTSTSSATASSQGAGQGWTNPANITSNSAYASVTLSPAGGTYYPAVTSGSATATSTYPPDTPDTETVVFYGFASVAETSATLIVNVNGSANPIADSDVTYCQVLYSVNSGATWTVAQTFTSNFGTTVAIPVSGITNLNTLQVQGLAYAYTTTYSETLISTINITNVYATTGTSGQPVSQTLSAMLQSLAFPSAETVLGIQVSVQGYYTGTTPSMVSVSLGSATQSLSLTTSATTVTAGSSTYLWGQTWTGAQIDAATVGFNASTAGTTTVYLNSLTVTVYYQTGTVNSISASGFVFDIADTTTVTGVSVDLTGYSNLPCDLTAQLLINGVATGYVKTVSLAQTSSNITFGSLNDQWGNLLTPENLNSLNFGIQFAAADSGFTLATTYLKGVKLTVGVYTGNSNFNFIGTFTTDAGDVKNISLDANGNLYVENVTNNPGVLTLVLENITPNSYAVGINGSNVYYMALNNGFSGSDMPLQYTSNWIDRITQVGPGAAPVFTPQQASGNSYVISSINQPTQQVHSHSYYLQSQGPGNTSPGNVVTVYYSDTVDDSGTGPPDTDLINAFNSGYSVFVFTKFYTPEGSGITLGPYVQQVTSVGVGSPPGQPRPFYYFTYNLTSQSYAYYQGDFDTGNTVTYTRTLATLTTATPVLGLEVGNQITISGSSPSSWNAIWTITQNLNSGEFQITSTSVTSGVATYSYAVQSGTAPTNDQLVTVTGTTNANGQLNVTNATIVSSTGGLTGTFTVNVPIAANYSSVPEDGSATTAGTEFAFDPGAAEGAGSTTNPIYGNATTGSLTYAGPASQFISTGTKQGTVFFITRNGYYTAPAPPVTFTVPENTVSIAVTNIPVGPQNVVARGIAFTESGQNGTPGANFFFIPQPVTYTVTNVSYTANQTVVNDNTSSSATFFFTDSVLLNAEAIDVYGYNLFNNIEIGDPGWITNYSTRNFYGLCINKVQNFNNLSFDGGYLNNGSNPFPLGWSQNDLYGSLTTSPKFGSAYLIDNTSSSTLTKAGLITQTAYQDAYNVPIVNANTTYSVRVGCSNVGTGTGTLMITLTANGVIYGTFSLALSSMTSNVALYTGTLLTTAFTTVPTDLLLNVYGETFTAGAAVLIDRIDIIPTEIPVLTTTIFGSYAGLPEQVDAVTGAVGFSSENQQPVNGGMVLYDTFYGLKAWCGKTPGSSLYSLQQSANLEPAQWQEPEVSQKSGGAIGPMAYDLGEQWFLGASRSGLYLFVGGQPGKISQEIYQVWDAINWDYGYTIWVKVDTTHRKIYVGVPLPTPNQWLPDAAENSNPTFPNVILMCNYQGLDSGEELKTMPQMHTTMFGALNAIDMRRKWNIWQIPAPYANMVQASTDQQFYICNGKSNSQVYMLDETASTDAGATIDCRYTTAGLPELSKRMQMQGLGAFGNTRATYLWAALQSAGTVNTKLYPNRLIYPQPSSGYQTWEVPGGFTPGSPALYDCKCPLNFAATRTFVEFRENDGNGFSLSNLTVQMKKDVWNMTTGSKGGATP